jgi:hypothetical protein
MGDGGGKMENEIKKMDEQMGRCIQAYLSEEKKLLKKLLIGMRNGYMGFAEMKVVNNEKRRND